MREEGKWSTDWLKSEDRERCVKRGGRDGRGWLKVDRRYVGRSPKVRWVIEEGQERRG